VFAFKRIADYHVAAASAMAAIEGKIVGLSAYRARTEAYEKGDFSRYDREELPGVQAVDPHTLRIRLTTPFPQLPYVLAMGCYAPMPREVIDYYLASGQAGSARANLEIGQRSAEIHDFRAAVGTGPFYLQDFVDGGRIILRRNPDFRAECYPDHGEEGDRQAGLLDDAGKRLPLADVIYLDYVCESNPRWMLFITRQSDLAGVPMEMYASAVEPSGKLDEGLARRGISMVKYSRPDIFYLAFNMQYPVLGKSRSLRRALCLAYNVEEHIRVLHNGRGVRAVNTIPQCIDGHNEAGPAPYARYDLAQAREMLLRAREELARAGAIQPGQPLPPLTLDLGGHDEASRRWAEFAQQQFAAIGIELRVELQDWPTLQDKVRRKQCQIYAMAWHAQYPDPMSFLSLYYGPNIARGTNKSNYADAQFDRMYEQAVVLPPSPRRTELCAEMVRKLGEDCPMLLLSEPVSVVLVQPWVHNVKPHPFAYGLAKYRRIDDQARRHAGGR
jgi:oligopeptide transport system substrate-binding protein